MRHRRTDTRLVEIQTINPRYNQQERVTSFGYLKFPYLLGLCNGVIFYTHIPVMMFCCVPATFFLGRAWYDEMLALKRPINPKDDTYGAFAAYDDNRWPRTQFMRFNLAVLYTCASFALGLVTSRFFFLRSGYNAVRRLPPRKIVPVTPKEVHPYTAY